MVVDTGSMEAALQVGRWLTEETLRVYRMHNLGAKAKPPIRRFLDRLPDRFETSDAKEVAEANDIARRTLFKWLDNLQDSGDVEKIRRGLYRKT
jgi:DNA invertase Pin-like site-specific DNA recombinase